MGDYSLAKARLWQRQQQQRHADELQPQQQSQQEQSQHNTKTNHLFSSPSHRLFIQIALGPHEITLLSPYYIVYHMEQPWSVFLIEPSMSLTYRKILTGAMAIFTFSNYHREVLIQLSQQHHLELSLEKLFIIPIYTTTENNHAHLRHLFRNDSYMFEYYANQHQDTNNNNNNNNSSSPMNTTTATATTINKNNIITTTDTDDNSIPINTINNGNNDQTTTDHIVVNKTFSLTFFGGSSPRRIAFFTRFNDPALYHRVIPFPLSPFPDLHI